MKDMLNYKGYYGSINFDKDDLIFYGKVEFIKALVSYESDNAKGLKKSFEEAVEDYLHTCQSEGLEPEKPFKGSFNIRTGHELHEQVAILAQQENISVNRFVCNALQHECNRRNL